MPLHVWLPRAHPIAPAPVSALMSGVMIKVALYGLVRVLVDWVGVLPLWLGVLVLAVGALSALGGVVYALFQHELKRLLALHSIENVGIIVLGLGACLVLRAARRRRCGRRSRSAPRCCTRSTTRSSRRCCSSAPGAFERAVGALELDRLGGLLRRMPWTGRRVPRRRDGDRRAAAAERLRVGVADAAVAAARAGLRPASATASPARSRSPRWRRRRRSRCFCFVKVVGLVLLGPPRRAAVAAARGARGRCGRGRRCSRAAASCSALVPGLLFGPLAGARARGRASRADATSGLHLPGTGSLPTARDRARAGRASTAALVAAARAAGAPRRRRAGRAGSSSSRRCAGRAPGFTKPLRLVLEAVLRPQREIAVAASRRRRAGGHLQRATCRT